MASSAELRDDAEQAADKHHLADRVAGCPRTAAALRRARSAGSQQSLSIVAAVLRPRPAGVAGFIGKSTAMSHIAGSLRGGCGRLLTRNS